MSIRPRLRLLRLRPPISVCFIVIVDEFSNLAPGVNRKAAFSSVSPENQVSGKIRLSNGGELIFQFIGTDYIRLGSCKVFILDNSGIWQSCGESSQRQENDIIFVFPVSMNFKTLMNNKQRYLRNDAIILKCEVDCYEVPQNVNVLKTNSPEISAWKEKLLVPKKEKQKSPSTLADDLFFLYKEGTLYDTKLRIESETFPVHKTVLSARSPVFKKMFTSDMKEKTGDYIDIPDINADTARRLLIFIYTDTADGMTWQNAMELYFAADKYQIDSLKVKCSTFLKLNVQPSNCSDLLLLSDMHQDVDLKQFVQDYIVRRDEEVFGTDEWRTFMNDHVHLAADTMYLKYARK